MALSSSAAAAVAALLFDVATCAQSSWFDSIADYGRLEHRAARSRSTAVVNDKIA